MNYKVQYDSELPFSDGWDYELDEPRYMVVNKGDVLDDTQTPFTPESLEMLKEQGLLKPLRKTKEEN